MSTEEMMRSCIMLCMLWFVPQGRVHPALVHPRSLQQNPRSAWKDRTKVGSCDLQPLLTTREVKHGSLSSWLVICTSCCSYSMVASTTTSSSSVTAAVSEADAAIIADASPWKSHGLRWERMDALRGSEEESKQEKFWKSVTGLGVRNNSPPRH